MMRSAMSDWNQRPLESPSAADSHEFSVNGAEMGAATCVEFIKPKNVASRTLPGFTVRPYHRLGRSAALWRIEAARSLVPQSASAAQSVEYSPIWRSIVSGSHRK